MALKTTNFELIKPQLTDMADITAFNENWDKIDEQLKKAGESGGTDLIETEEASGVIGDPPTIDPVIQIELDALKSRPVNNNILINSNFTNPVNQRAMPSYPTEQHTKYTIDRWCIDNTDMGVTVNSDYITVTSSVDKQRIFAQHLEFPNKYVGKTITASIKYRLNSGTAALCVQPNSGSSKSEWFKSDGAWHTASVTVPITATYLTRIRIMVWSNQAFNVDIEWIKAEIGETATPYVPRLYGEELCLCQRFYQVLYPRDSVLYMLNSNTMIFAKSIPVRMQTQPTCILTECQLDAYGGVEQDGFDLQINSTGNSSVTISCNKTSHGITVSDLPTLGGLIYLDAEL